jgi:hypothetical protein
MAAGADSRTARGERPPTRRTLKPSTSGPAELLQRLIRFETTNPPGNERECIDWVQ